jgi:hypothetical protein
VLILGDVGDTRGGSDLREGSGGAVWVLKETRKFKRHDRAG